MGRAPKSAEAHKLDGTYRPARHADSGIKFNPAHSIDLPEEITDEKTIKIWESIIPELCEKELVSIAEVPVLEYAFVSYQHAQECLNAINNAGGMTTYLINLSMKERDLSKYYKSFMNEFNTIMFKFGVTPVENPKVHTAPKKTTQEEQAVSVLNAIRGNG